MKVLAVRNNSLLRKAPLWFIGGTIFFRKKVIIEYDDCGIYIYKKFEPIKTIRFEEFRSRSIREDFDEVYVMRRHTIKMVANGKPL